jgi:transposase
MEDIDKIIGSSSLVVQRVLAVKMVLNGYSYAEITDLLGVSQSFVEKWRALYHKKGSSCFALGYKGSEGYLSETQKKEVIDFLTTQQSCSLETLTSYIEKTFGVIYKSKQSYYDLFDLAGMSWKKTEKINPKKDEQKVLAKQEDIKKNFSLEEKKYFQGNWSF